MRLLTPEKKKYLSYTYIGRCFLFCRRVRPIDRSPPTTSVTSRRAQSRDRYTKGTQSAGALRPWRALRRFQLFGSVFFFFSVESGQRLDDGRRLLMQEKKIKFFYLWTVTPDAFFSRSRSDQWRSALSIHASSRMEKFCVVQARGEKPDKRRLVGLTPPPILCSTPTGGGGCP